MPKVAVLLATYFAHPWGSSIALITQPTQIFPMQELIRRQDRLLFKALVFGAREGALGVRTCIWLLLPTAVEASVLLAEHYVVGIIPVATRTELGERCRGD